jgi:hypothetical protein
MRDGRPFRQWRHRLRFGAAATSPTVQGAQGLPRIGQAADPVFGGERDRTGVRIAERRVDPAARKKAPRSPQVRPLPLQVPDRHRQRDRLIVMAARCVVEAVRTRTGFPEADGG